MNFQIERKFNDMFKQISQLERNRNSKLIKQEFKLRQLLQDMDRFIEAELEKTDRLEQINNFKKTHKFNIKNEGATDIMGIGSAA